MSTLTVTSKGQVTLRQDLLKHLGIVPGEQITVDKLPDGQMLVRAKHPAGTISDVFNFLKNANGPKLSLDEIKETAEQGWARKR